jgi:hypothetical protein
MEHLPAEKVSQPERRIYGKGNREILSLGRPHADRHGATSQAGHDDKTPQNRLPSILTENRQDGAILLPVLKKGNENLPYLVSIQLPGDEIPPAPL